MGGPCFLLYDVPEADAPPPSEPPSAQQVVQQTGVAWKLPSATVGFPGRRRRVTGPSATDNFQVVPFEFAGAEWQSVEQCYQAKKFNDEKAQELIRTMLPHAGERDHSHGMRVWSAGGSLNGVKLRSDWDAVKVEIMLRVCRAKLAAHAHLRAELLATGDVTIVGAPSTHWQSKVTGDHNWSTWNGRIQELLREEIRAAAEDAPLSERGAKLKEAFAIHMAAEGGAQHSIPGEGREG